MADGQGSLDLLAAAPCGVLTTTSDGLVLRANDQVLAWTGYDRVEIEGRRRLVDLLSPGSRIYHESHFAPLLRLQQDVREIAFTFLRRDGTRFPALVTSRVVRPRAAGGEPHVLTVVFDASDRQRYEEELRRERRRVEETHARLERVQQAALRLALVTGMSETALATARSAIGVGGTSVAALWLPDDDGAVTTLRARATAADVERPTDSARPPPVRSRPVPGPAPGVPSLDDLSVLGWAEADDRLPSVTAALSSTGDAPRTGHAVVLVPVRHGARQLGLLACRLDDGPLDPVEADLLRALSHQAGTALARALLHDQQRELASALQHSLLPDRLPASPRFTLAYVYEPGDAGAQVGGDWYDAYLLDDHRLAVVVGDVVGRGVQAAATMGQLRSALRAVAAGASGPADMLGRLDLFVDAVPAALCATVVLAVVDLRTGTVTWSSAGHPPPLLLGADGSVTTLWDGRSLPLGLRPGERRDQAEVPLPAGASLLLYTDGLVERRRESLPGRLDELAGALAGTVDLEPQQRLEAVRAAMLGSVHSGLDDVCLLALTLPT